MVSLLSLERRKAKDPSTDRSQNLFYLNKLETKVKEQMMLRVVKELIKISTSKNSVFSPCFAHGTIPSPGSWLLLQAAVC